METASTQQSEKEREKQHAALSSVVAAVLLTGLKLSVGILTGSLGILAEAAHSGLDLVAALVTFLAVRLSDRPADKRHMYGHGKIENMSALVETLLLLLTCAWIIYEAVQRLFFKTVHVETTIWAFAVMAVSIVVDFSRSRILARAAEKHKSQALEADALHFSTDIWSSSVVIVGLAAVWLSQRLGTQWAWLGKADAGAALAVAFIVIYVSIQLGRRTVAVLLDSAPPGLAEQISHEAGKIPGVQAVNSVRVRQAGATEFIDLVVDVDRSATLEGAHEISSAVEDRLTRLIPEGDVVIHVEPVRSSEETLFEAISTIAARYGLHTHNVHAHQAGEHYTVDLDVEVPPDLNLEAAHALVTRFEAGVRQELPRVQDVNSHIEPVTPATVSVAPLTPAEESRWKSEITAIVEELPGVGTCGDIHIRPGPNGYDLALHCSADPQLPVAEAHRLADQLERRLQAQLPNVGPITVHIEPDERRDSPSTA